MKENIELRDYFAAKAMQALLNTHNMDQDSYNFEDISILSYDMASEMLKTKIEDEKRLITLEMLDLRVRTLNGLKSNGIDNINKLLKCRRLDLLKIDHFGVHSLHDVVMSLKRFKLSLED